jgi:hypothetical protein
MIKNYEAKETGRGKAVLPRQASVKETPPFSRRF